MNPSVAAAFACRSEEVTIRGVKFTVRELDSAANLQDVMADDPKGIKLIVACTFLEDGVTKAFTVDDLPFLESVATDGQKASAFSLADLIGAINRVNGGDTKAEVKNLGAVPSDG